MFSGDLPACTKENVGTNVHLLWSFGLKVKINLLFLHPPLILTSLLSETKAKPNKQTNKTCFFSR